MSKGSSLVLSIDCCLPAFLVLRSAQAHRRSSWHLRRPMTEVSACSRLPDELEYVKPTVRKRKVIEHVVIFQMKMGFTEEQEKDMLDHLYTLQYQLRGIISISLGSTNSRNADGSTHGLFMRFPSREALESYYESPSRWKVANEYIIPYYNGLICVDYEAEVEDDIEPIFRRGEAFEQGIESLTLLQVKADTDPIRIQESFDLVSALAEELGTLVVQHTSGTNISSLNKGYTHGMVMRFPSEDARDSFTQHSSYVEIMESKFMPITLKMSTVEYSVAPVGATAF
ncbi:hypothetical protein GOP47_0015242 [Adiantum capillus-veneris]|uniref:Stress-response A/B barrel domain-containing protein n=1 Tax=Adiantum capillus-veneris TaxID=13818 RepID=A0A9D4UK87_ADICA|nr:hypothetical protein GOP47_0015242 [Adiantum capillus-veneris]